MPPMEDLDAPSPCEGWHDESEVVLRRKGREGDVALPKGITERRLIINYSGALEPILVELMPKIKESASSIIHVVSDHSAVAFGK